MQGDQGRRKMIQSYNVANREFRRDIRGTAPVFIPQLRKHAKANPKAVVAPVASVTPVAGPETPKPRPPQTNNFTGFNFHQTLSSVAPQADNGNAFAFGATPRVTAPLPGQGGLPAMKLATNTPAFGTPVPAPAPAPARDPSVTPVVAPPRLVLRTPPPSEDMDIDHSDDSDEENTGSR